MIKRIRQTNWLLLLCKGMLGLQVLFLLVQLGIVVTYVHWYFQEGIR